MSTLKLSLVGLGSRLVIMLVAVINTVLLARLLGPWGVGEYFVLLRVVLAFAALADFGLTQSANVFFGRHAEWGAHIHKILLRFVLVFSVGTSVVGLGILWLAGDVLLPNFPWEWTLMAFGILPMVLYGNFWNSMMIGMGRIWHYNLVLVVFNVLSLILTLVFVAGLSGGVTAAAINFVVATSIQFVIMIVVAFRLVSGSRAKEPPADLSQQMLRFGLRAYPGSVSHLLWTRLPFFMLNAFYGAAAVGIFSVAQQLVEKLLLPILSVQDAIYRKMTILPNRAATLAMNRYLRLTSWGMLVVILAGVTLAPWMIVLLLGEAYAETASVFRVLLFGTAFMSVSMLLAPYFLNQLRRPGLLSILAWITVLVNVLLGLLFIPSLAELGAALALTLTQIIATVVVFVLYLRITRVRVRDLTWVSNEDITLLREQVGALLWWKGNKR